MNKIERLFTQKQNNILSIYFTAGYPKLNSTTEILTALKKHGADLVEIGVPFSDPLADGPSIQKSGEQALKNGMSLKLLFEQLASLPPDFDFPMVLMSYYNPIYKFGVEKVVKMCATIGISGLIIPDMPLDEYKEKYKAVFQKNNLSLINLVSPQTSDKRLKEIDRQSSGFIYAVSSNATTGSKKDINQKQEDYFLRLKNTGLKNPFLIGFGISNAESFNKACEYASGAIIGSAFVKSLTDNDKLEEQIENFIKKIK